MTKILVIQQKMIGDVLVSSILCETLSKAYTDAQIDYLIYESTHQVIQENVKKYHTIFFTNKQRESKTELLKFAKKIRKENYDIIIDAYSKLESWVIVGMSKAKKKISFKKGFTDFLYTDLVVRHEKSVSNLGLVIEHRLKLLEPLNIPKELYVTQPKIKITEQEDQQAQAVLERNNIDKNIPVVMMNIIGSSESKTYPPKYMAQIIDQVAGYNVQILFNYIPKQIDQAKEIFDLCKPETQNKIYFNVLGNSIREFLALMNNCVCIIGNDGGAMNMAKALDKPTFIIFSPWIYKEVWATFEDGFNHISVHLKDFRSEWFEGKSQKELLKINDKLYNEFSPDFILNQVDYFCENHLL